MRTLKLWKPTVTAVGPVLWGVWEGYLGCYVRFRGPGNPRRGPLIGHFNTRPSWGAIFFHINLWLRGDHYP